MKCLTMAPAADGGISSYATLTRNTRANEMSKLINDRTSLRETSSFCFSTYQYNQHFIANI